MVFGLDGVAAEAGDVGARGDDGSATAIKGVGAAAAAAASGAVSSESNPDIVGPAASPLALFKGANSASQSCESVAGAGWEPNAEAVPLALNGSFAATFVEFVPLVTDSNAECWGAAEDRD